MRVYQVGDTVTLINRKELSNGKIGVDYTFFNKGQEHLVIAGVERLPNGIKMFTFERHSRDYRLTEHELEINAA